MTYLLSLLDKSPISPGEDAAGAVARTVALAQRAEELGYHRFWVAEHHGTPTLASSAPEVLASFVLARTSRIRVGSGGVMLQHYSPYKVAESFNLLASLAPGRVDLGIGKAPGGLPFSTRALQWAHDRAQKQDFAEKLALLDAFLGEGPEASHPLAGAAATPRPPIAPERYLLGASADSGELAGRLGWAFVYAAHFNGDPANIAQSFEAYARASGGKAPLLALAAIAAETEEEARAKAKNLRTFKLHLPNGQSVNIGSEEQAAEFARQAGFASYRTEEKSPSILAGTGDGLRRELDALHRHYGVGEFILEIPLAGEAERLATIELLARRPLSAAA